MPGIDLNALKSDFSFETKGYQLTHYLNLSLKESLKILEYRNHDSVRSSMIQSNLITKENHIAFVQNLTTQNRGYWTLKKGKDIIGSISLSNLDFKEKSCVGGNFLNPKFIGSGRGIILNYFMHYLAFEKLNCRKITALVKVNNKNANRLNQFFGGIILNGDNFSFDQSDYNSYEFSSKNWQTSVKAKADKMLKAILEI